LVAPEALASFTLISLYILGSAIVGNGKTLEDTDMLTFNHTEDGLRRGRAPGRETWHEIILTSMLSW
jgi:hypothetical protein